MEKNIFRLYFGEYILIVCAPAGAGLQLIQLEHIIPIKIENLFRLSYLKGVAAYPVNKIVPVTHTPQAALGVIDNIVEIYPRLAFQTRKS